MQMYTWQSGFKNNQIEQTIPALPLEMRITGALHSSFMKRKKANFEELLQKFQ